MVSDMIYSEILIFSDKMYCSATFVSFATWDIAFFLVIEGKIKPIVTFEISATCTGQKASCQGSRI